MKKKTEIILNLKRALCHISLHWSLQENDQLIGVMSCCCHTRNTCVSVCINCFGVFFNTWEWGGGGQFLSDPVSPQTESGPLSTDALRVLLIQRGEEAAGAAAAAAHQSRSGILD